MRNRIFGAIGVLWGAAIVVPRLIGVGQIQSDGAYAAGQLAGFLFGFLLIGAGAYTFMRPTVPKAADPAT